MEQVAVPDQKPRVPLNQGLYDSVGNYGSLELKWTEEDDELGPFGDLWRPWGSNLEVTLSPVAIWVGPHIKLFSYLFFDFFFVCKMGPS